MKLNWKSWNHHSSLGLAVLFYAVCGLLLLLWPTLALSIASYAVATLLCIAGIICIISYMRKSILQAVLGSQLAVGLITIFLGILLFANPLVLGALLPFVWGFSLLIGGFGKVQMSIDMKRIGDKYWWGLLIAAVASFLLGTLAIMQPVFIAQTIIQFIGVSLLVEAVVDIIAYIIVHRKIKEYRKDAENTTIEI